MKQNKNHNLHKKKEKKEEKKRGLISENKTSILVLLIHISDFYNLQ
jgi:hypothetical protein